MLYCRATNKFCHPNPLSQGSFVNICQGDNTEIDRMHMQNLKCKTYDVKNLIREYLSGKVIYRVVFRNKNNQL